MDQGKGYYLMIRRRRRRKFLRIPPPIRIPPPYYVPISNKGGILKWNRTDINGGDSRHFSICVGGYASRRGFQKTKTPSRSRYLTDLVANFPNLLKFLKNLH